LTCARDDGIVVVMTTFEYLDTDETNRPRELAYGVLREPPAPFFSHQAIVLRIAKILSDHVEPRRLGQIAIAPLDVILDVDNGLIVQPDVLFVSQERLAIIHNQVWGAPDLVVEVLSRSTAARDRAEKLGWYRQYGVRECWLVDLSNEEVAIVDLAGPGVTRRLARGTATIRSSVLPEFVIAAAAIFIS